MFLYRKLAKQKLSILSMLFDLKLIVRDFGQYSIEIVFE